MTHQPSQPTTDLADFTRRMMSNIDGSQDAEIAAIKARITELESNEADYESILGPRTYNEVAEHIRGLEGALKDWLSFAEEELSEFDVEECTSDHLCPKCERSGCINMKIADTRAALSHTGPVARDGER